MGYNSATKKKAKSIHYVNEYHWHQTRNDEAYNRIVQQRRKQHHDISNDLYDVSACMPSALDSLKFEVLVASQIDPKLNHTQKMLKETKKMVKKSEEQRIKEIMDDESNMFM